MPAKRIPITSVIDNLLVIEGLASQLRKGALCVYPTETIYGVGGLAGLPGVADAIYEAKDRPQSNPMILIADRPDRFDSQELNWTPIAQKLAHVFWPGNLTLVLDSAAATAVGVRVSNHPFVQALCPVLNAALYSTSANRSGDPYNSDPTAIYRTFSQMVAFMVDAGSLPPTPPSTVVACPIGGEPTCLREGVVPWARIEKVVRESLL